MKLRKQTLDGNIETMLLSVLVGGSSYGYQIVQDVNERTKGLLELGEGTVYPVLHRMERRGLIKGLWQTAANNRKRKYYRLTPLGRTSLDDNRRQFQGLITVMEGIMEHVGPLAPANP